MFQKKITSSKNKNKLSRPSPKKSKGNKKVTIGNVIAQKKKKKKQKKGIMLQALLSKKKNDNDEFKFKRDIFNVQ